MKYVLVLYLCITGQTCIEEKIVPIEYPKYYDCLSDGYIRAYSSIHSLGVETIPFSIPMVYLDEALPKNEHLSQLKDLVGTMASDELLFFHSARLFWKKPVGYTSSMWIAENKNNDWFIRAFSEFIKLRPTVKARLTLIEYGPDVDATKALVSELGLANRVLWLPKMQRKQLLWI